jgi:hypothetical protein
MIHDQDIYESAKNGSLFSIKEHWYGQGEYYILVNEDNEKEIKITKVELQQMIEEKRLNKT